MGDNGVLDSPPSPVAVRAERSSSGSESGRSKGSGLIIVDEDEKSDLGSEASDLGRGMSQLVSIYCCYCTTHYTHHHEYLFSLFTLIISLLLPRFTKRSYRRSSGKSSAAVDKGRQKPSRGAGKEKNCVRNKPFIINTLCNCNIIIFFVCSVPYVVLELNGKKERLKSKVQNTMLPAWNAKTQFLYGTDKDENILSLKVSSFPASLVLMFHSMILFFQLSTNIDHCAAQFYDQKGQTKDEVKNRLNILFMN